MKLGELAVEKALSMGATEAEAYLRKARIIRVEFTEKIEKFKTIDSKGIGLRVALGKRVAMHSTSILNESEIDKAVAKAIKIAKVAPEDPHWKHMNRKFSKGAAEEYYDSTLENIDYHKIVETIISAVNNMKSYDRRVEPTRGVLSIAISDTSMANSCDESCERKETAVFAWMRAKAEEAGLKGTGTEHQEARYWKEINFKNLAVGASEKAVKFMKAKPISGGTMPVIVTNKIFANILGVILSGPINADWVQKGRSPLSNKLGAQIASENVNIADNGIMPRGLRTRPFDDEGHQTQRTPVIEKGTLKNYLYDTYTALKDNIKSTGNAQRFYYWMTPQPSPNNLILRPGEASLEEIVNETKHGLYIVDTIGEWLSNPVSGNLNATVTHGYLVENGELTEPVKGVVISGIFYEILKNGIEIMGKDLKNSMQNYSPTVKLTQLTIAGE